MPDDVMLKVPEGEELRCPHFVTRIKKDGTIWKGVCNWRLCKGSASIDPQEFKCKMCGNVTTFQRIL